MLIRTHGLPDIGEKISREIEFQAKRGLTARRIAVSPEAMEAMRLFAHVPEHSVLREHDGLPVSVDRRMIGVNAWRVFFDKPLGTTEQILDLARKVR